MRPVIDHVPFGWSDLDALEARFRDAGFDPEYGGTHSDGTTEMSTVAFPDGSYLELVAPTGDGEPGYWPDALAADAGPCAWCAESPSVHGECQRLIDFDVPVHGPFRRGRTRPDGVEVEWDLAFFGEGKDRHRLPFVITDRTPRDFRISPDETLIGGPISGVGAVVVGVRDLDAAVAEFARLYRFPNPVRDVAPGFGADLAAFPGQDVVLAEPHEGSWLDARIDDLGARPCSVLLSGDVDEARGRHPVRSGHDWFGRRVAFIEGFDSRLGVINRTERWTG